MKATKTRTIEWGEFSEKHKRYINRAAENRLNVAEGAIRSGKTIDNCIIAARYLETCRDRFHLASGSTLANAKLNIGVCNGYGLENLFRGRCHWGKYMDNSALFISTQTGEKIVIFVGGGKADSYKRILGNSYGLWIATEINEHYDCDDARSSFISVAMGRQAAAKDPLILWDLNPGNPRHWVYRKYIDYYGEHGFGGGYQHQRFKMADNKTITEERRKELESTYTKGSIWYRRDIDGERCVAEGLVYPDYEKAIEAPPADIIPTEYSVAIDYGTQNPFAALLFAKYGRVWYSIREYYYNGRETKKQKTDSQYLKDLKAWLADILAQLPPGRKQEVIIDPSAASFIAELERSRLFKVWDADNDVEDGIREFANAIENGYIKISPACTNTIDEFGAYCWDPKAAEEGVDIPLKENDHAMDAGRYFVKTKDIIRLATRRS